MLLLAANGGGGREKAGGETGSGRFERALTTSGYGPGIFTSVRFSALLAEIACGAYARISGGKSASEDEVYGGGADSQKNSSSVACGHCGIAGG